MKKWLLRILMTVGLLFVFSLIGGYVFLSGAKPDYAGSIKFNDLNGDVDVYYDKYAVPHIYASSVEDAFRTLGYVHAKDRLWQMDLIRRIAPGRLSELFGEGTLETDKFFRTIGLAHDSKKSAVDFEDRLDDELKRIVTNYVDGINSYIQEGEQTMEHLILGIEMEPYTIEDVYNVIGYMSFSFSVAHRTEPITDYIAHSLGEEYLKDLDVHVAPGTTTIDSEPSTDYSALSMHINHLFQDLPAPELIGSNSWVIGTEKSKSGGVLFANDPHIGFSQPSVWYEAHLEAPGFSQYGYHIAGFPMAQIGHNRHHAIGLTMFENDDIDYYREKVNENNKDEYWAIDQWAKISTRSEVIKVKGSEDITVDVRNTRHGPILSDVVADISSDDPVSMWWTYQKFPNKLLEASYRIMTGTTLEEVRQGAAMIHAPGLNVMYGDVEGNIAWWAAAKLPHRPEHLNSKLIHDGASGKDDITEFYAFEKNPQSVNPEVGFVYSANNQSVNADGDRPPGYYLPEDRARRIVHLLTPKDDWTIENVKNMLNDVVSENAPDQIVSILSSLQSNDADSDKVKVLELLDSWDGSFDTEEVAPTVYVKLTYHILSMMMKDELADRWDTFNGTHLMKRSVEPLIANLESVWWDNVGTEKLESRTQIIQEAFNLTIEELTTQLGSDVAEWKWGRVHNLVHPHSFDANPTLKSYFNVGPFSTSGSTDVINNQQFRLNGGGLYNAFAGPSSRRAIDMSDIENVSWAILPTGQSGNVLSPHYKDQAEMYVNGEFRKQLMNKEEIVSQHLYHLQISAN